MNGPAVVADRLSKRYGQKWALHDGSLTVPAGRLCALVGPNGAGKSTLLELMAGLTIPSEGRVEALGSPPEQGQQWLAQIGYLAQELPLYKRLTADELLVWAATWTPDGMTDLPASPSAVWASRSTNQWDSSPEVNGPRWRSPSPLASGPGSIARRTGGQPGPAGPAGFPGRSRRSQR
jgi:ABC-type branched-subunit amino acid transport system ATPase component